MTDSNRTGGVSENTSINDSYAEYGDRADYPASTRVAITADDRLALQVAGARLAIDMANDRITLNELAMSEHIACRALQHQAPNAGYVAGWERRIAEAKASIAKNEKFLADLGVGLEAA